IPTGTPPPPPADPVDPATAPAAADSPPSPYVHFSPTFELDGGKNIEIELATDVHNNWAYVAADLVNVATGDVSSAEANVEAWNGVEDGEAWSEGSPRARVHLGPVAEGDYMLRLESQHGGSGDVALDVTVRQGVFRGKYLAWACIVLAAIA